MLGKQLKRSPPHAKAQYSNTKVSKNGNFLNKAILMSQEFATPLCHVFKVIFVAALKFCSRNSKWKCIIHPKVINLKNCLRVLLQAHPFIKLRFSTPYVFFQNNRQLSLSDSKRIIKGNSAYSSFVWLSIWI